MGSRREQITIDMYAGVLRRFCQSTGKTSDWTKKDLVAWIDGMIKSGKSMATINTYFGNVKSIFRYLELDFGIDRFDLPRGSTRPTRNYSIDDDVVERMIRYVRSSSDPDEGLYLCLSTVYGLRRVEISTLEQGDFDANRFKVHTAKHGEPKMHLIPVQIQPYIDAGVGAESVPVSPTTLSFYWTRMCKNIGYDSPNGQSWHSVRRSLVTHLLRSGLPQLEVKTFMRWQMGAGDITEKYFRIDNKQSEDIDRKVFAVHPYLRMWG